MSALREAITENAALFLLLGGLAIGALYGIVARLTGFCTLGGLSDWVNIKDSRRLRAWGLAAGIAILGATILEFGGVTDLSLSIYLAPRLDWAGALLGGTLFGIGMALASGCPSRNLVRAGGGDLRALLTLLVLALFAEMTLGGVFAPARVALAEATMLPSGAAGQSLADLLSAKSALGAPIARLAAGLGIGLLLVTLSLLSKPFLSSPRHLLSGLGVGAAVVVAWAITGLAYDEMALVPQRPQSLSFVSPTADAFEWLGRSTAKGLPGFAAALVFGVLAGSALASIATRGFRIMTFADAGDTVRHLLGAALMGTGGIMGLGCSIGQGITGISTLALGSLLATAGIILGALLGLRALERWAA